MVIVPNYSFGGAFVAFFLYKRRPFEAYIIIYLKYKYFFNARNLKKIFVSKAAYKLNKYLYLSFIVAMWTEMFVHTCEHGQMFHLIVQATVRILQLTVTKPKLKFLYQV